MPGSISYPCISCGKEVRPRQEALECPVCLCWQHRTCGINITRTEYRQVMKGEVEIDWRCDGCKEEDITSTPQSTPSRPLEEDIISNTSSPPSTQRSSPHSSHASFNDCNNPPSPNVEDLSESCAVSFNEPVFIEESDLEATILAPDNATAEPEQQRFEVVIGGSKRGKDILVEIGGYSYGKDGKVNKKGEQRWRCCVRNKVTYCNASVTQLGEQFRRGAQQHICNPGDSELASRKIKAQLRQEGAEKPFVSGSTLVKNALQQHLPENVPATNLPSMSALVRSTNRVRQKRRPAQPRDLKFEWEADALPDGFVQEDILLGQARHIIMFLPFLLSLLKCAKTWYVDGTFKAVQKPFAQLFSIHAFIKQDRYTKQVPLMFVLMSRRSALDYKSVLQFIKDKVADLEISSVIMDFESAVWKAFKDVFPAVKRKGCCFHWCQSVFRKIQNLGLAPTYRSKRNTATFLRELMSLPFLPAEQIPSTFQDFQNLIQPTHPAPLHQLMQYLEDTWIYGNWTPTDWSVYKMAVRTNNDIEGYHHGLNRVCDKNGGNNINIYELIHVLFKECKMVSTQCQLVSQEKLERYQRKTYREYQTQIFNIWDDYSDKKISPRTLLIKTDLKASWTLI